MVGKQSGRRSSTSHFQPAETPTQGVCYEKDSHRPVRSSGYRRPRRHHHGKKSVTSR